MFYIFDAMEHLFPQEGKQYEQYGVSYIDDGCPRDEQVNHHSQSEQLGEVCYACHEIEMMVDFIDDSDECDDEQPCHDNECGHEGRQH